jgi:hypothetical protein
MKYTETDIQDTFARWCKAVGVKQAQPLPPIVNGHYEPKADIQEGIYCIPDGIMRYGIAKYVNTGGGIDVIMRAISRNEFVDMMKFAIKSISLYKNIEGN